MKRISKLSFLFLLVGLFFFSCDRDNLDETTVPDPGFEPEVVVVNSLINALTTTTNEGFELGCLSVEYPFMLLLEDDSTIEVLTDEELEAALNQESPFQVVDFVFPLTVTTADEESVQVNNTEELAVLFASCIPEEGWDDTSTDEGNFVIPAFLFEELCFNLVYPVNLQDEDGNAYVAASELELVGLIINVPSLAFTLPMEVVDDNGEGVLLESVSDFYSLYYSCDGNTPPSTEGGIFFDFSQLGDCEFDDLTIQFPYVIETEDGELITIVDENQEAALILSGVHYTVAYPFNLVDDNGDVITINDEMEFIELILPCLITIEPTGPCDAPAHVLLYFNQSCGVVNYPNQLSAGGMVYAINSMDDYFVVYNQYNLDEIDIVYPISVTDPMGVVLTFNSNAEVCAFIEDCF